MSKKLASLLLRISANGAEAQQVLRTLSQDVTIFAKKAERVGRTLTTYITLPLAAAAGAAVKLANTQLQAEAKLLNALNGRSDVQQRLIAQAGELQSRSTIGDEEIIAQQAYLAALGLTETQIGATMNAAVQLSAALGISLESAVKNLAKTFGGMTGELGESIPALKNLTKEQLMAGEAIDYVNENYKGFAETAASTGAGPLEQLKNQLGDIGEQLGVVIVPALQTLVGWLKKLATWVGSISPEVTKWIGILTTVGALIFPIVGGIGKIVTGVGKLVKWIPKIASFVAKYGKYFASGALSLFGVGVAAGTSDRELVSTGEGLSAASAAEMLRQKYTPAVEAATEANEKLAASYAAVALLAPKPKITPVSGIATNGANLAGLGGGVEIDTDKLTEQIANTSTFAQGLAQMRANMQSVVADAISFAELAMSVGDIVAGAFNGMVDAMAEGFRALGAGEGLADPWASLLKMLGTALESLGKELIIYSGIIEKIKAAFTSLMSKPFGWGIALAAGAAAVAAGAAMRGRAEAMLKVPALASGGLAYAPTLAVVGDNRGAASDPEVIAPLSKLRQYMGAPSLELAGDVTLRVDGYDLVAVLNRTNTHLKYRG